MKARFTASRFFDVLAVLAIAFVAYRLLIAPRIFSSNPLPAPHVTYESLAGPPFVLTQHRGRVVFLDFWASWCEPCKLSLPLVESFARAHPEVDVVPVDVGEPRPVVASFAASHRMEHVALDTGMRSQAFFQLDGFPTIVVIDPRGRVRASWQGYNPAVELNMMTAEQTFLHS